MCEIWTNFLLPKALKNCPKSNKSPNLVTLGVDKSNGSVHGWWTTHSWAFTFPLCSNVHDISRLNIRHHSRIKICKLHLPSYYLESFVHYHSTFLCRWRHISVHHLRHNINHQWRHLYVAAFRQTLDQNYESSFFEDTHISSPTRCCTYYTVFTIIATVLKSFYNRYSRSSYSQGRVSFSFCSFS